MLAGLLTSLSSKLAMMFCDLHPHATAAMILLQTCAYISLVAATQRFKGALKTHCADPGAKAENKALARLVTHSVLAFNDRVCPQVCD